MRVLIAIHLLFGFCVLGQDTKSKDIETDRPDVTPYTIPKGSFQMENGVAWTGDEGGHILDLTESLLRIGVASGTELRFGIPDYFHRLRPFDPPSGFNDLLLGVKQSLGTVAGFDFAVVPAISLPTGSKSWSSHGFDPQIEIPWQHDLSGLFRFSWKWRGRSPSKVKERTHEEATEALHAGREGRHPEAASAGEGAHLEALR